MVKVGFTGTQKGMDSEQQRKVQILFESLTQKYGDGWEFHHGDCIGSDIQAHREAKLQGCKNFVIHPPENPRKRAFAKPGEGEIFSLEKEKPYLERNRDIVDVVDFMVATPATEVEERRSGTWFTIRYARKLKKRVMVFFPLKGRGK